MDHIIIYKKLAIVFARIVNMHFTFAGYSFSIGIIFIWLVACSLIGALVRKYLL